MRLTSLLPPTLAALSLAASGALATCADFEVLRRNSPTLRRAATTEAEAASEPLADECVIYSYEPVRSLFSSNGLPTIWQTANFSKASADELALYNALSPSIPNIAPRGTRAGNFTGVTYDGPTDPDCWWSYTTCTTPKIAGLQPDVTRCPEPNVWGFTLDDGPNCSHNAFYDYLNEKKQKATLFYIGSNVVDWPLEAQRGLDDGHEICAHTWSHPYMTALTNEQVFAELYYSKKAIKAVLGITVQCWRPPYGDVDDRVRYIAQALGLTTVVWHDNTFDYDISTLGASVVEANYNSILAAQANGTYNSAGTIVLTHELNNLTMTESENFLPKIQAAFKAAVPVAVCHNNSQPYVETGYTYPNFAQYTAGTTSISLSTATATSAPTLSLPLSSGQSGSLFATLAYTTPQSGSGSSAPTTSSVSSATSTSSSSSRSSSSSSSSGSTSSASAASTTRSSSAQKTSIGNSGFAMALVSMSAVVLGALFV